MKIMFLQKLTGGLLNGLLKPRLNGLFARTPVLAVLLLTAVVAACGSDSNSSDPAAPSSDQPPVSNQAPVFSAGNSPGVRFTNATGTTTPASYIFAGIPLNSPANYLAGNVSAIDPDGDTISYNISGGDDDDALFRINSTTGEITLKAQASTSGGYTFNVTASDGKGGSTIATISVEVLPNQAPMFVAVSGLQDQFAPASDTTPANYTFAGIPLSSAMNGLVGNVSAMDPDAADGDAVTYNISNEYNRDGGSAVSNALFQINSATGEITLKTTATDSGVYTFNVIASDVEGASTTARISVTVGDPTPPEFIGAPYNFDLDLSVANATGVVVGNVSAVDAEGTLFDYSLLSSGNLFGLAPAENADGSRNITLLRAATLSDFAASSITFVVIANHQEGQEGTKLSVANIKVNLNNDLQLDDDSDGDRVNDFYDASPHDDTTDVTGNGEPDDPYIISNIYQLQAIAGVDHTGTALDSSDFTGGSFLYGTNADEQLTKHYELANDIDTSNTTDDIWTNLEPDVPTGPVAESSEVEGSSDAVGSIDMDGSSEGHGWTPIAGKSGQSFSGSFSGEGYAINSLTSMLRQDATSKHFGLFGINNGNITAIGLQNIDMGIEALEGAYTKDTRIDNIISGSHAGGLVGLNQEDGIISYSYTTGDVNASMDAIGGLVGLNEGEISYSYSTAAVLGEGDTGGLVGANERGAILSSYTAGRVDGGVGIVGRNGTTGGLAGSISGEGAIINSSYAIRNVNDVTMPTGSLGGVVAERGNDVTIEFTYWDKFDGDILAVGKQRVDVTQLGDIDGTAELSREQLQGCELDGMVIAGVDPGLDCSVFFPSSHWGNNTKDGVTRGWNFRSGEYPSLRAVRSSDNKQLLPSAADQECQLTFNSSFC